MSSRINKNTLIYHKISVFAWPIPTRVTGLDWHWTRLDESGKFGTDYPKIDRIRISLTKQNGLAAPICVITRSVKYSNSVLNQSNPSGNYPNEWKSAFDEIKAMAPDRIPDNIDLSSGETLALEQFWAQVPESVNRIVFFDLETTGLSPFVHDVLEIGAIAVDRGGNIEPHHSLILIENPENQVLNGHIHGIDGSEEGQFERIDAINDFRVFCRKSPLVAHNIKFDISFIWAEEHKMGKGFSSNPLLDSCEYFKQLRNLTKLKIKGLGIEHLSNYFSFEEGPLHRAFIDTWLTFKIWLQFCSRAKPSDIRQAWNKAKVDFSFKNFDPQYWQNHEEESASWPLIRDAIEQRTEVQIRYTGGSHGRAPRPVKPLAIFPNVGGPVLYGECLISNTTKSFALKKIIEVKSL